MQKKNSKLTSSLNSIMKKVLVGGVTTDKFYFLSEYKVTGSWYGYELENIGTLDPPESFISGYLIFNIRGVKDPLKNTDLVSIQLDPFSDEEPTHVVKSFSLIIDGNKIDFTDKPHSIIGGSHIAGINDIIFDKIFLSDITHEVNVVDVVIDQI